VSSAGRKNINISSWYSESLQTGQPRNCGSIPGTCERFIPSPKRSDVKWCPHSPLFKGHWWLSLSDGTEVGAPFDLDSSHMVIPFNPRSRNVDFPSFYVCMLLLLIYTG